MEFAELIQKRYSCRSYKPDPVEDDKLSRVLEAARLAPTAANRQPFQVLVIPTAGRKDELLKIYPRNWLVQAPLVVGVCGLPSHAWVRRDGKNYVDVDAAIVMDHLILAAADLGLGTCWIGAFDAAAAKAVLKLGEGVEPIVFTPLGYAADAIRSKQRKPLTELVRSL